MARWLVILIVAGGCGRLGFDEHRGGGGPADSAGARDGAGGRDARPSDAPAHDAGPDAAPACATRQLCDTFEAQAIDASVWAYTSGVTLDATVAHRGAQSLHVHSTTLSPGVNGYFVLSETKTFAASTSGTFYVRAWVRLGALPASTNGMELISANQSAGTQYGDFLFVKSNQLEIYTQFSEQTLGTGAVPPTGTWFCALWTVTRSTGTTGSIALAGDPPPVTLSNVITDGSPLLHDLDFGIGFAGTNVDVTQPALDLWLDDVIVDSQPITCAE